ncbi:hypothetical protein BX666DRAFT_1927519 [Dichotomocladium elegans]|nr:hypothetical protein BX666DRAFT_1927519 [Dichotomocladium elegans]
MNDTLLMRMVDEPSIQGSVFTEITNLGIVFEALIYHHTYLANKPVEKDVMWKDVGGKNREFH